MAYTLNAVNLSTYGIIPGQASGGNIALQGCFDMPARMGETKRDWGDENGVEPYIAADDYFFSGRDIVFSGLIIGTTAVCNAYLQALYTAIEAFTGLVTFSTPYGDFSVLVKEVDPEMKNGVCQVTITFREPVVTLTGGTLPAIGTSKNTIGGIPLTSFGIYLNGTKQLNSLPELKEQLFTKYGAEGYQIVKRNGDTIDVNGYLLASDISDLQSKIKALYLLFQSTDLLELIVNNESLGNCFLTEGFKVEDIIIYS